MVFHTRAKTLQETDTENIIIFSYLLWKELKVKDIGLLMSKFTILNNKKQFVFSSLPPFLFCGIFLFSSFFKEYFLIPLWFY
ncbi:MAG: hypothetical protein A2086_10840 [Spirochaetes bacterium GWD1_27_9]|nr:MAG: hypothetical protein A2Y34_09725 [Spirochaetes bacterium GWC1_27_15]OHD35052.1 MAG: hypothetical protein A2086_10840 [Spirochaetes bacterium GWD1_27_9]